MEVNGIRLYDIPGAPGYFVDRDGGAWSQYGKGWKRIKSREDLASRTPRKLKASPDALGYPTVTITIDGKKCRKHVSNLVLLTFVGPCPDGMEACHFPDRDPLNNRPENLRWDTHAGNMADMRLHGTSRLKVSRDKETELIRLYVEEKKTLSEAAVAIGVGMTTASRWLRRAGLTRKHTRGRMFVRSSALSQGTTDFGRRMAALRIAANLSQREVEKLVGVSAGLISCIERGGVRATRREVIEKLAPLYGQDPVKLWAEAPKRKLHENEKATAEIVRLYVECGQTLEEVGEAIGVSAGAVHRRLRQLGVDCSRDYKPVSNLAGKTAFGRKLAELRLAKGMSQPQVSAALNGLISANYLGRLELGARKTAKRAVVEALAKLYDVDLDELNAIMGPRSRGARDLRSAS